LKKTRNDGWSDVSLKGIFWTWEGRLDRRRFFQRIALVLILGYLASELGQHLIGFPLGILFSLPFYLMSFSIMIRRVHDCGWPVKWAIILWLIPLVNCIFLGVLLGKKGVQGANVYGEPPLESLQDRSDENE
jgi:uncharacterized membrane protein YhaH (DUF805 family)